MEKYAWRARVLPGMENEYKRRHDAIWPKMQDALRAAGIRNYSIWLSGNDLFGYYECEHGAAFAARVQAQSPAVAEWNEYMRDVMVMDTDPETGAQPHLQQMFEFEGSENKP